MRAIVIFYSFTAIMALSIFASGQVINGLTKENARQKTLIQWLCNDLPTHEACEGYQEEARLNK